MKEKETVEDIGDDMYVDELETDDNDEVQNETDDSDDQSESQGAVQMLGIFVLKTLGI